MSTSPSPVTQLLESAKQLIQDPAHWTQGFSARDSQGENCLINDEKAVCFCSLGAIHKAGEQHYNFYCTSRATVFLKAAAERIRCTEIINIPTFNDSATHTEVMQAFSMAIRMSKGEQS